ncbi:MAG: alpha/beta fold hydrolase [Bradyrhizobium sp.]|nr:MAG: alpha/beta fold hydrolase [Bradyrhizobium sp.]
MAFANVSGAVAHYADEGRGDAWAIVFIKALGAADLRPYCAAIKVPTLCVVGEEDGSTTPPVVRELAGQIGQVRFEMIAGAGHLPNIEQPEALRGLIETLARDAGP